jgi:predicted RNA binding protein YcfA (HicA-like mRNA interferase family)
MTSEGHGTIVNLRSEDAAARIATWYGTELPARGWELEKQSDAAGSHLVIAHKAGRKATVLITGGPQGSQILLTVLEER